MATFDNTYSRFIAWMKIILPLLALGLLSTLFLFSRGVDDGGLPYSEVDIEELAREPRVTAPNYTGVTPEGVALSVYADVARPDAEAGSVIDTEEMRAAIDAPDGLHVDLRAAKGRLDGTNVRALLEGDVFAETSTGYSISTERLDAAAEGTLLRADTPVTAQGPFGTLDAGGMELGPTEAGGQSYLLVFKGGVKLVYRPQDQGEE